MSDNSTWDDFDLVIEDATSNRDFPKIEGFTVSKGNILDCEKKIINNEPVKAVCICHEDTDSKPPEANSNKAVRILRLMYWNAPYSTVSFGNYTYIPTVEYTVMGIAFHYDAADGRLLDVRVETRQV